MSEHIRIDEGARRVGLTSGGLRFRMQQLGIKPSRRGMITVEDFKRLQKLPKKTAPTKGNNADATTAPRLKPEEVVPVTVHLSKFHHQLLTEIGADPAEIVGPTLENYCQELLAKVREMEL